MSQSITHACANCGSSVPNNTRFCPNCGTPADAGNGNPASYAQMAPPPYPTYPQQAQSVYQPVPSGQQRYQPPVQHAQPPPAYARPQKNSSRRILKVGLILLILLVLLGTGGFFAFRSVSSRGGNTVNTGTQSNVTPTQASLSTTPINTTFTYASVNITILNAQQATSFADDHDTPAQGVVRLNLHAVQLDVNNVYSVSAPPYAYGETFALLLPGGKKIALGGYKDISGPARKGEQTTWVDFPASTGMKVNQMILQIGKDTEEQLQVPLTGHADLSQYQPKQSTPNLRVAFGSMFWTLKTVTLKLSDSATQSDKGKRFLVLSLSIDNLGTEGNIGYPPDYIRLHYGGTIIALDQDVIGNADAGTTNTPGLVSFLVPQDITTATFILLPGHTPGATSQATISFQIP